MQAQVGRRSAHEHGAAKVKQWPEPGASGAWSRLRAHEIMEAKQLSPNPPPDSIHRCLFSERRQNPPAPWGGDSSILYSSIGVTVEVKGMGPSRKEFCVQQRPPSRDPQTLRPKAPQQQDDPSAFPARGTSSAFRRPETDARPRAPLFPRGSALCRAPDNLPRLPQSPRNNPSLVPIYKVGSLPLEAPSRGHLGMSDVSIPSPPSLGGDTDLNHGGRAQGGCLSVCLCLSVSFSHMLSDWPQPAGTEPRGPPRLAAQAGLLLVRGSIYLCLRQSQRGSQLRAFRQG